MCISSRAEFKDCHFAPKLVIMRFTPGKHTASRLALDHLIGPRAWLRWSREGSLGRALLLSTGPLEQIQPRPLSNLSFSLSLSIRSSDSEEAFETPESTTPVKAPPAPPLPPPEVIAEPEVSVQAPPEEPGNQGPGTPGAAWEQPYC